MQLEQFRAGQFEKGYEYRFFLPTNINDEWIWQNPQVNALLEKAAIKLGELNSFARLVPNIDLFIQLHVTKEAVVSSRIEGTQTNMQQAVLSEAEISPEHRNDWREVQNYIEALNQAITTLQTLPLSSRLLKETHAILLSNVRGEHKLPGEFRISQNWIGGNSLSDATFIPPHHQYVNDLMSDLERFLHNDDVHVPALIRVAIAHYQFETIHPFLDGNGRIGRLLITLFLVNAGILDKPLLYLSSYFEKNKGLYYDNLMRVRTHSDMLQWLKYFLVGIEQTASLAVHTLSEILKLKARLEKELQQSFGRRNASAQLLLNSLFEQPATSVEDASRICDLSYKAANDLIGLMSKHEILHEVTGQTRNRVFVFAPYLDIFDN
ncbi:Fic family protein [Methylophilus sp. 14]|nr:Fic family protein [Methylophilus sp. 14]